jgi:hypothetical protein
MIHIEFSDGFGHASNLDGWIRCHWRPAKEQRTWMRPKIGREAERGIDRRINVIALCNPVALDAT